MSIHDLLTSPMKMECLRCSILCQADAVINFLRLKMVKIDSHGMQHNELIS